MLSTKWNERCDTDSPEPAVGDAPCPRTVPPNFRVKDTHVTSEAAKAAAEASLLATKIDDALDVTLIIPKRKFKVT